MKDSKIIPPALMQQWEQESIDQKIPYTEFGSFLKMKEQNYWQRLEVREERKEIFTNAARNKLTEYGNKVALDTLLAIPMVERVCKFARFDFEDLQERLSNGFKNDAEKVSFLNEREHWFGRLKDKMKELRISKETLQSFGLDFKACKQLAYQTL